MATRDEEEKAWKELQEARARTLPTLAGPGAYESRGVLVEHLKNTTFYYRGLLGNEDEALYTTQLQAPTSGSDYVSRHSAPHSPNLPRGSDKKRYTVWVLPDEVTLLVFSFCSCTDLTQLALVCRAWRVLANDCVLWATVSIKPRKDITDDKLAALCEAHPSIARLNINDRTNVGDFGLSAVALHCKKLRELRMRGCERITDAGLQIIALSCGASLRGLYADNCRLLTNDCLKQLGPRCPNLSVLELAGCSTITDEGLKHVSNCFHSLMSLGLSRCYNVTKQGLAAVLPHCHNLRRLYLRDCTNVCDGAAQLIAQHCKKLEILNVGVTAVGDEGLRALGEHCVSMQRLYLRDLQITDEGLSVITSLRQMEILFLNGCTLLRDHSLAAIGPNLRELVELSIENVPTITDEGLQHVGPHNCPNIERLFLTRTSVSDKSLEMFAMLGGKLHILGLNGCENVSDAGLAVIGDMCDNLHMLWVLQCPNVTRQIRSFFANPNCEIKHEHPPQAALC